MFPAVIPYQIKDVAWRSGDALYDVKANFCGMMENYGDLSEVIYTPNTSGAMAAGRWPHWAERMRAARLTHVFMGDFHPGAYPGYPLPNPDLTRDPAGIRAYLEGILNTPSADGLGFTPIVMLDGGAYSDSTPRERVDNDWPIILQGMTEGGVDLRNHVIVVPGWELIYASQWSSADMSYALQWLSRHGFVHIGVHNSPGRVAISSNPVQDDDPWQGEESDSYKSHGGEHVRILFMQIEPPRPGDDLQCAVIDNPSCPFDRWNDACLRPGGGYRGWRKMYLCAMETVATWFFRGKCDEAYAREVATRCREIALAPVADDYTGGPVTISYGNGLPYV